jgi:uncharacterized protein YoxC
LGKSNLVQAISSKAGCLALPLFFSGITYSMNRQFYEFWGTFFTHVAHGQKQLEEMTDWMQQGFAGAKELNELFRHCYGLSPSGDDDNQTAQQWQKAIEDFQQTLGQLAKQWGWVSQTEHQKVLDRCAALEEKVKQQQITIKELRALMEEKGLGYSELFQHIQSSVKEQSEQFNALMENIHKVYTDKS